MNVIWIVADTSRKDHMGAQVHQNSDTPPTRFEVRWILSALRRRAPNNADSAGSRHRSLDRVVRGLGAASGRRHDGLPDFRGERLHAAAMVDTPSK